MCTVYTSKRERRHRERKGVLSQTCALREKDFCRTMVCAVYTSKRERRLRESGSLSNVSEERNLSYNVVCSVYVKEREMFKRDLSHTRFSLSDTQISLSPVESAAAHIDSLMLDVRGNSGGDLCHIYDLAYLLSNQLNSPEDAQQRLAMHVRRSRMLDELGRAMSVSHTVIFRGQGCFVWHCNTL